MSRRNYYSDQFAGTADRGIRFALSCDEEDDRAARLRRIMLKIINNELTPRQKEIIVLYYFREMDIVAIGRKLGVTPQSVSAVLARGRVRLFRFLQYYI